MVNDNHKTCEFAEQTVSYLYGETAAIDKNGFESHLKNCSTCADELESFGFIRSAILDWRNEEFAKLNTPVFDIPATKTENVFSPAIKPTESRSWLGGFRKLFSFNPALAALAVLVVCLGAALFAFKFSGDEITENENDANLAQAVVTPIAEASINSQETNNADEGLRKSLPNIVKTNDLPSRAARKRQTVPVKTALKVSGSTAQNESDNSARKFKNANDNAKKIAPAKRQMIPNLNDAEDEEDRTIRLADLFDELDAR